MATSSIPGFTNARLWMVLGSLMLATLLATMEVSIIATALPTIAGEFNAFESFAWVGTAYIVTSAIGTPLLGKLSDIYGRRTVFQVTMGLFIVGSFLCGISQSMGQLIAARALQGLGGGAIQALSFAIIGDILPPRERGRYIGYFTLAFVGAALLGPLIGGLIIDHWTWPWIFFINIPLALIASLVSHRALNLPFHRRKAKLDILGATLLSITIGALMIALEEGTHGWTRPTVLWLLGIALVGLIAFIVVEQRAEEPMIPLRLFRNRTVLICTLMGMGAGTIAFGAAQFLPLYFQDSLFVSPTESGLRMMPQMVGVTMATFGVGRLIARTGRYKRYPVVGTALASLGLLAVALMLDADTSYAALILPMIAMGFGMASVFTTTSIASQNAVEFQDLGVTTATIMFFRSLGGSFGLAAFGTILNSTIRHEIPARIGVAADEAANLIRSPADIKALPDDARHAVVASVSLGVSRIYLVCAVVTIVAFLCTLALPELPLRSRAGLSDAMEARAADAAQGQTR